MTISNDMLTRILGSERLNEALAQLRREHVREGFPDAEQAEAELQRIVEDLERRLAEHFPETPPANDDAAKVEAIAGASKALMRELLLHVHRAIDQTPFIGPSLDDPP